MTRLTTENHSLSSVIFECSSHPSTLLQGFASLRAKNELFDITLIVEGEKFFAHRSVLAACSDYFRAMFTDNMKESRENEICLNGVSAEGMNLLLDYVYSSRLILNLSNVQTVLAAASHVQISAVVESCSRYLQSQLDLENCVDIATIAETYCLEQLRQKVYRFISGNLIEFSQSAEFYRLAPQQLEHLLQCDFPVDCSEEEVLRIVLMWLCFPGPRICTTRFSFALRILQRVHFSEISRRKVEEVLQKVLLNKSSSEHCLYRLVLTEMKYRQMQLTSNTLHSSTNPLVNSRGMELAVVKVGGFGMGGITNEITYCLANERKWRHLTSIPHVEQCNFGTAVLGNELFVVGGCFNQSLQEIIHPFGFRYNPRFNKWSTMAPMQQERCRFSLNVVNGRLYAIGGANETEVENLNTPEEEEEGSTCECYNPENDTWSPVCSLSEYRTQHAGATVQINNNCLLFISGGLDRDLVLSSVRCYDSTTDSWQLKAKMLTSRADHVMIAYDRKLYVCGGWNEDTETGNRYLVNTIDSYDVLQDRWQIVTEVPTPRYHAGIVGVGSKIYFIGGFHSDVMFDRDSASIECYDIDTDQWTTGEKYPQDVWEHTCVTLYIPRYRDDDMEVLGRI